MDVLAASPGKGLFVRRSDRIVPSTPGLRGRVCFGGSVMGIMRAMPAERPDRTASRDGGRNQPPALAADPPADPIP